MNMIRGEGIHTCKGLLWGSVMHRQNICSRWNRREWHCTLYGRLHTRLCMALCYTWTAMDTRRRGLKHEPCTASQGRTPGLVDGSIIHTPPCGEEARECLEAAANAAQEV